MSTFGERLIEARGNLSTSNAAKKVGVKYRTYYNWEHDIAKPLKDSTIRNIADAFGVTYNWLVAGVGEKDKAKHAELLRIQQTPHPVAQGQSVPSDAPKKKFFAKDARQLEDIELVIKHLKDMNLSDDEKKAVFLTLSEIRTDLEVKVLFGVTA